MELPNGKVITVEVPVNVTPVKPIETPVTTTPFTPEDYTKGITIPEGGKVTKVENIPDLTTPGKKAPVKVTVELPNGKVITVEVPVTVTPKDTPVKPTIKTKPIVVAVGDPVTKEDVELHIDLPKGAEIVEIGEIPTTETPGQKPSVKVKVKLPSGEIVEVEVSVIVTPKATQTPRPEKPSTTEVTVNPEKAKATVVKEGEKVLPNTGINDSSSPLAGLGLAILGLATLVRRRKQK